MPFGLIGSSRMIVCEGVSDAAFVRPLLIARQLDGYEVRYTGEASPSGTSGIDMFRAFFEALPAIEGFYDLKHIVVVGDCDEDPNAHRNYIRQQIGDAVLDAIPPATLAVPAAANVPNNHQPSPGSPAVHLFMLPADGEQGCLESLCLAAATAVAKDVRDCVDALADCSGASQWSASKVAKMKLQALLSSTHKRNPALPLYRVWIEHGADQRIPLSDSVFDPLAEFLAQLDE